MNSWDGLIDFKLESYRDWLREGGVTSPLAGAAGMRELGDPPLSA